MFFNREYIVFLSIFGIILLYSYYYFLASNSGSITKLWGNITGNLLIVYYISMVLATIGFILLFYYLLTTSIFTQKEVNNIFYCLLFIIIISIFWMPLSLKYLEDKNCYNKSLTIFVLFLVAISSLYLIYLVDQVSDRENKISKTLALIGLIYFFIHVFLFDFIIWDYNFFMK